MAELSWPFYGVETTETQFSKWARQFASSGIMEGLSLTPGTGMQVVLGTGIALVQGFYYENDATKTLTVGAAPGSGTRRDAIILRLDLSANTITAVVKAGSANTSGGALPSLTQNETTWELLIGWVSVASGAAAITASLITAARPSPGIRVYPYVAAQRPTPEEPIALGVDTTTKRLELWVSGAWVSMFDVANLTGTVPISKGGTGATNLKAAQRALGFYVTPTDPGHAKGRVWFPGTEPA